jgi:hypothetical protein
MLSEEGAGGSWGLATAHPQETKSFRSGGDVTKNRSSAQGFAANKSVPALPDLQALVAEHGGWHLITVAAWSNFDDAIARYRAAQVAGIRREQARCNSRYRATTARNPGKARKGGAQ